MVFLIKGLKERGQGTISGPDGETRHSTFTCFHCNKVVVVVQGCAPEDMGGLCKMCMGLTCPECTDKGSCDPFEKKMERAEASDRARRSYGLG